MREKATHLDLDPLPELIGYVLRRAQIAVFQDFFRSFAPYNIRPAQFAVLNVIERNPGLTQSQVAGALGIKRTNFVGMLDELETRGLAERRQTTRDRRSYALYLTDEGLALMRRLKPVLKGHESRLIARLGEDGRDRLIALLHLLAERDDGGVADETPDGAPLKGRASKASRSPRPGSAET
jgi:DNA-binding MarR family transcriptional regulator